MVKNTNIWNDEVNTNWISSNNESEEQKKIQRDLILFKKHKRINKIT